MHSRQESDTMAIHTQFPTEVTAMDHENKWDDLLHIRTVGRDDTNADEYRYPYEPTPYTVLERLADSGLFRKSDTVLDYGCGKGRVGFFLASQTGARTIGIEYDPRIHREALENNRTAKAGAEFILTRAEEYALPPEVNRCYFFNPFSVEILHKVLARIMESYYDAPRDIFLFFYYPSWRSWNSMARSNVTICLTAMTSGNGS